MTGQANGLMFRDYPAGTLRTFTLYRRAVAAYPGDDAFGLWVCRTYPHGCASMTAARARFKHEGNGRS